MAKRMDVSPVHKRIAATFLCSTFLLSLPGLAQQSASPDGSANLGLPYPSRGESKTEPDQGSTNKSPANEGQARKDGTGKVQTNPGQANQDQTISGQTGSPTNDRILYAVPNFLTVENAGQVPPVSAGRKFKLVAQDSFDYFNYPWYAFLAGISQAENSEAGYGQGAAGYGKRYAATFADGTIENFTTGAVFPALLHQDPRYFQLGKGGFFHRAGYSVSRVFITRTDSGSRQINYSEIAGAAVAAGLANLYHPVEDRNFANTMSIWGTDMGWDAFTFFVKEFWPDLKRKLKREKN